MNGEHKGASVDTKSPSTWDFRNLFDEYYPRLVLYAFEIIGDKCQAEDVVQEAFVKYWKNKGNVATQPTTIKNYLYATVRNASFNILRHEKVKQRFCQQQVTEEAEEQNALYTLIQSEVIAALAKAIHSLPEGCQRISCLSFLEGMKNEEVANHLGVSINTVKTQKRRAIQLLRMRMNPEMLTILLVLLARQ